MDGWNNVLIDRLEKFLRIVKITQETFGKIIDYQNIDIHSCFIFQNCLHYLILFFIKQIEKARIYRQGLNSLVAKRF